MSVGPPLRLQEETAGQSSPELCAGFPIAGHSSAPPARLVCPKQGYVSGMKGCGPWESPPAEMKLVAWRRV